MNKFIQTRESFRVFQMNNFHSNGSFVRVFYIRHCAERPSVLFSFGFVCFASTWPKITTEKNRTERNIVDIFKHLGQAN